MLLKIKKIEGNNIICEDINNKTRVLDKNNINNIIDMNLNIKEKDIIYYKNNNIYKHFLDKKGTEKFLSNIKGIGKKSIEKIIKYYENFDDNIRFLLERDIVVNDGKNLLENKIITKKQFTALKEYFENVHNMINYYDEFFIENSISEYIKNAIEKYYLKQTGKNKLSKKDKETIILTLLYEPYKFTNAKKIGFKTIDKIAIELNKKYNLMSEEEFNLYRAINSIEYILKEAENDGHMFLRKEGLKYFMKQILKIDEEFIDKNYDIILSNAEKNEHIKIIEHKKHKLVYLKENYEMELRIAQNVIEKLKKEKKEIKIEKIIEPKEFNLSEKQKEAIKLGLTENILIVTGGPGSGKTTVSKYIYENLKYYYPEKIIKIAAPTGTAAKRIGNVIGTDATTIHVMLKFKFGRFEYNGENKLPADIVIIDEASMINAPLFDDLLKALKTDTKLILIGDIDQLPAIGKGDILNSLIKSKEVPIVRLDTIFRQDDNNKIPEFAFNVNNGIVDYMSYRSKEYNPNKDLNIFIKRSYSKKENENYQYNMMIDTLDIFYEIYKNEKLDILDIQILTQVKRGIGGIDNINREVQSTINDNDFIEDTKFKIGDKVIQTFNNYNLGVMNGSIGIIKYFDSLKKAVGVEFIEGTITKTVEYTLDKKDKDYINRNIELAYCISVHKSQGNEWEKVIFLFNDFFWANRKVLYTAITRAKKQVNIITNHAVLTHGIKTPFGVKEINGKLVRINRNTLLDHYIKQLINNKILNI